MTPSSRSRCRSRSCTTMVRLLFPAPLFPVIEHLVGFPREQFLSLRNVVLDVGPHSPTRIPCPIQQVGVVHVGVLHGGHLHFRPTIRAALHNRVPLREIL